MPLHNPFVPVAGANIRYSDPDTLAVDESIIPRATDTYDLGSSTRLWRKGYLSELDTLLFAKNTITLLGGWFYVTKDAGTLEADVAALDTAIDFGKAMTVGHFVVMRAALKVEYLQVGALVSGTVYNVTRNLDGTGANDWPAGTPFAVLGTVGDGRIELNAYDTPRISLLRQGATYNAQTENIRIGDLNGLADYASENWGIFIGDYASNKWLAYDPVNHLRIRGDALIDGTVVAAKLNVSELSAIVANMGSLTAGQIVVGSTNKLWLNDAADGALAIGGTNKASAPFRVTAAGALTATSALLKGEIQADAGYLGALSIDGLLSIGASGEIRQGTGALGTDFTGLRIWREGGVGRIAGYNADVIQWEGRTDGRLYAGGGAVSLDSTGIVVAALAGISNERAYKFRDALGNIGGRLAASSTLGGPEPSNEILLQGLSIADCDTMVHIGSDAPTGRRARVQLYTYEAGTPRAYVALSSSGPGHVWINPNLTVTDGLNVGTATGAGTGEIRASGEATWSSGRTIYLGSGFDLNTLANSGWYDVQNPVNAPVVTDWAYIMQIRHVSNFLWTVQQFFDFRDNNNNFIRRSMDVGGVRTWSAWRRITTA